MTGVEVSNVNSSRFVNCRPSEIEGLRSSARREIEK